MLILYVLVANLSIITFTDPESRYRHKHLVRRNSDDSSTDARFFRLRSHRCTRRSGRGGSGIGHRGRLPMFAGG
ncbi:uncharacterized protein C8Q71DRAFT_751367 [Rhodofomes roseus]|uniref:Secreted protein n=1 Tax=Rhodofomes roseus TaxID=34475 RepID=A0ABQ8KKM9_9APHY|nr:uncharacterized protein C8Q71DRAFT_751367 [Rhodofomes roseus]KAH9838458.1 hypothetical protein C8Q71DRAFT_751367 [Rhodofomes roseus]